MRIWYGYVALTMSPNAFTTYLEKVKSLKGLTTYHIRSPWPQKQTGYLRSSRGFLCLILHGKEHWEVFNRRMNNLFGQGVHGADGHLLHVR